MWDNPVTYLAILGGGTALVTAGVWVGSMNEHKSTVADFMAEIRDDVKKILRRLPTPIEPTSPLSLTEYGEAIAEAVGAARWVEEHAETVRGRATGKPAFEVQEITFAYAREEYELSPSIREAMYEHGYTGDHVRAVLGVVLRDELLGVKAE